jgi:hypothetical protein
MSSVCYLCYFIYHDVFILISTKCPFKYTVGTTRPPKKISGHNLKAAVSHCFFPGKAFEDLELLGDERN